MSELSFKLRELISSYWKTQLLYVVAKLGIADLIEKKPVHFSKLAAQTKTQPPLLYRLLRALASLEIFAEEEEGCFKHTPLSKLLRSNQPGSLKSLAVLYGEEFYEIWEDLLHTIKTGEPAFHHRFGGNIFTYFAKHPNQATIFNQAMRGISQEQIKAVLDVYDFSKLKLIVDVGGGMGHFLEAILEKSPKTNGILFDMPHVVREAQKKSGLDKKRCRFVAGDFFKEAPSGGDAYLLKYILHDWDDEHAGLILKNCRKAMSPKAKLIVIEQLLPPANKPHYSKLTDIHMMVLSGGIERSKRDFAKLFGSAGFEIKRIVPTSYLLNIIEAQ